MTGFGEWLFGVEGENGKRQEQRRNGCGWWRAYIPPIASARWMGHPGTCGRWRRTGNGTCAVWAGERWRWRSGFLRCGGKCAAFGRNDRGLVEVERKATPRRIQGSFATLRASQDDDLQEQCSASGWRPWRRGREVRSRGRLRGSSRLRSRWLFARWDGRSQG